MGTLACRKFRLAKEQFVVTANSGRHCLKFFAVNPHCLYERLQAAVEAISAWKLPLLHGGEK